MPMKDQANKDGEILAAKKNWQQPELRSLPIAATAGHKGSGDEGVNGTKSGDSGPLSS